MLTDNPFIGTYAFTVQPFTEDFTGRISWGALGNTLLLCAQRHADSHGFGFGPMSCERLSWVFSRLAIRMDRRPQTGEDFLVSTWATSVFRQFTTRLFQISTPDGKPYGWGHSIWALMHLDTRQPDDMSRLLDAGFRDVLVPSPDFPIQQPARIRVQTEAPVATRVVRYSDLDVNGHLNSIRAIDVLLDLFPKEDFADDALKHVEMAYAHECFCGEPLSIYRESAAPQLSADGRAYHFEVRRPDGGVAIRSRLEWG